MPLAAPDQSSVLATHNTYRTAAGINAPALQWDSTLATGAQSWADNLAANYLQSQQLQNNPHSDPSARQGLGENFAMGSKGGYTPAQMVDFWGKTEIGGSSEQGNFVRGTFSASTTACAVSKTGNWQDVGHYTQVIWNTTTKVGCGMASDGTNDYLVCRYSPAGNVDGTQMP